MLTYSGQFAVGVYILSCTLRHLSVFSHPSQDTKGTLFFKKLADLTSTKAKFASYNNDRIIFYEDDYTGKDFVAYVGFSLSLACFTV